MIYSLYSLSFISFVAHRLSKPKSRKEAAFDPLWHGVMIDELTALHQTHKWDFGLLPPKKAYYLLFTRLNQNLMGQLKGTRPYLLLKLTLSNNFDYEEICALISKMTTFHIMILVDFE